MTDVKTVRTRTVRRLWALGALLACGCGDGDDAGVTKQPDAVPAACDARGVRRVAGSEGVLVRGKLSVLATIPELASVGDNEWQVRVEAPNGEPVAGALVSLTAFMPAHGHGSPKVALTSDEGDGAYRIAPVALSMPGSWVVDVTVTSDPATGSTSFDVCVAE